MSLSADDRLAIHELLSLHGHLADGRRESELDRLITDDAAFDLEDFGLGVVAGLPALRELFARRPGEQPIGHHVTNVCVDVAADGTVRVLSKGLAVMPGGRAGTVTYDDVVVKTAAGWRIARRKVLAGRAA